MTKRQAEAGSGRGWLVAALIGALIVPTWARAGNERAQLRQVNELINEARAQMPAEVGGSVASEGAALQRMSDLLTSARAGLLPELAADESSYTAALKNLADLDAWLGHLRLSHACNLARQSILRAQRAGEPAAAALVEVFSAAVDAFAAGARSEGKSDVDFFSAQRDKLRAQNEEVARGAAERAATAQRDNLLKTAGEKLAALYALNAALQPVTPEAVAALEQATASLNEAKLEAARYYLDEIEHFRIERDWGQPSLAAEKAIAAELGGSMVAKGRTKAKQLKIAVRAKAGQCYLAFMQLEAADGTEQLDRFEWKMGGAGPAPQELTIRRPVDWKGLPTRGFCTSRAGAVNAKALVVSKMPIKGLRWVVVEVPRDVFPRGLAASLQLTPPDHCDAREWLNLWTQPVPGAFAYVDGEPIVIKDAPDAATVEYWTAGNPKPQRTSVDRLSGELPAAIAFRAPLESAVCPGGAGGGVARAALSRKIADCNRRVDQKFAAAKKKVDKLRAAASKGEPAAEADELMRVTQEKEKLERETRCGPLAAKAAAELEMTYNALVETLTDRRYHDPLDRSASLRARSQVTPVTAPSN